jgi:ribosomal protein S8
MTTTIILQIPDDVAQQLQAEAQQQNTTLENLAAERLIQNSSTHKKAQYSLEIPSEYTPVIEMFNQIRAAHQAENDHIQIATTPITRVVANSMVRHQLIQKIEIDETQPDAPMVLYLSKRPIPSSQYREGYLDDLQTDDPRLKPILEKLRDPDPDICIQGINELGDYGCELA